MARSFPLTTDFIRFVGSFPSPAKMSVCWWVKNPSVNDFWTYMLNDVTRFTIAGSTTGTNRIEFSRPFSTTTGIWNIDQATHGMTLANWNHYAFVYDGTSTANNCQFYANGVAKTMTRATAPVGTVTTTAGDLYIGRWDASGRNIGGAMDYVNFHNDVLTAQEVLDSMNYGYCPRARVGGWILKGDSPEIDVSGNAANMAVTGTTVVQGPPGIMMPRRPVVMLQAVSRAGTR